MKLRLSAVTYIFDALVQFFTSHSRTPIPRAFTTPVVRCNCSSLIIDVFGLGDCSNIFEALGRCKAPFAGDSDAAMTARNNFIDRKILPGCNAMGAMGWCVFCWFSFLVLAHFRSGRQGHHERTSLPGQRLLQRYQTIVVCFYFFRLAWCVDNDSFYLAGRDIMGVLHSIANESSSDAPTVSACKVGF